MIASKQARLYYCNRDFLGYGDEIWEYGVQGNVTNPVKFSQNWAEFLERQSEANPAEYREWIIEFKYEPIKCAPLWYFLPDPWETLVTAPISQREQVRIRGYGISDQFLYFTISKNVTKNIYTTR